MTSASAYLRSVTAGYRRLLLGLGRALLAAAGLAAVAALIALPLTYLALEQTKIYTVALPGLVILLSAVRALGRGGPLRPAFGPRLLRGLLKTGRLAAILLLLYIGVGGLIRGALIPGILSTLIALGLIGTAIRR